MAKKKCAKTKISKTKLLAKGIFVFTWLSYLSFTGRGKTDALPRTAVAKVKWQDLVWQKQNGQKPVWQKQKFSKLLDQALPLYPSPNHHKVYSCSFVKDHFPI